MKKKILLLMLAVFAIAIAVVLIKTRLFVSRQLSFPPITVTYTETEAAAKRLSDAIKFKTVSYHDYDKFDYDEFTRFREFLRESFPKVHAHLVREEIREHSLLYTWKGSTDQKPIVFLAHQDVVPIEAGTEDDWTHPPFSGAIADGFVWGRGSLDDKASLMAVLEVFEWYLARGVWPRRTIYLASGFDEEVGGQKGALEIAKLLKERGVEAEYVLDEGGFIVEGMMPGLSGPAALIGISEKGYMTLELSVEDKGGHSAMPPEHGAIGVLGAAIYKLESNPFPAEIGPTAAQMFDYLGPEMPFGIKAVMANRWLFGPLFKAGLERNKTANSFIRTTIAATVFQSGKKENVLPQKATAFVNFRLKPGDSIQYVIEYVKRAIDDPRVKVEIRGLHPREASAVSDISLPGFKILEKTVREMFPDTTLVPNLFFAGTDCRHYEIVSQNTLRFLPMRMGQQDMKRIHGTNERISIDNYEEIIKFYIRMIENSNR